MTGSHPDPEAVHHAALRRVALQCARGVQGAELSAAIAAELERLSLTVTGAGDPPGQPIERTLAAFDELLASSVVAAEGRAAAQRLFEEQRALGQIATLVARNAPSGELFDAVTQTAGELLRADFARLGRVEPVAGIEYVSGWSRTGDAMPDGARPDLSANVVIAGEAWGLIEIFRSAGALPISQPEPTLTSLTELLGNALADAGTRQRLTRLADGHAALRRVATLVAQGAPSDRVYQAVTIEAGLYLGADFASLSRIDDHEWMTTLATWRRSGDPIPLARWPLDDESLSATVARTGRSVRRNDYGAATGPLADLVRSVGGGQGAAVPVTVEGEVWGVMAAFSDAGHQLPSDTERRLLEFTALLTMAVADTESRRELAASRARIIATADGARRRIERDLHDGAQQRLVSLGLELQGAVALVPAEMADLKEALATISRGLSEAQDELREIAHGVHPAILADTGLGPALKSLARRSNVPVTLQVEVPTRLPEAVEFAAYYIVKEALDNAGRHAHARAVMVRATAGPEAIEIEVSDDGIGGGDPAAGSGLIALRDRVEALSGTLTVISPAGAGTTLTAAIPFHGEARLSG